MAEGRALRRHDNRLEFDRVPGVNSRPRKGEMRGREQLCTSLFLAEEAFYLSLFPRIPSPGFALPQRVTQA